MHRRTFLSLPLALAGGSAIAQTPSSSWQFQYPISWPEAIPGDGFFVKHAYATEHAEFYPNLWHTGENWYAEYLDTAGAIVHAVADGEVVFAGYDYPGPVVIIQHTDDLFSQYGHLNYELAIEVGQQVTRGHQIGTVLYRENGRSHLHFELRTFYIQAEVNGDYPRYNFHCGPNCPPGPGYWPMDAPEHPTGMGWRNPSHVINHRMGIPSGAQVMVPHDHRGPLLLFEAPNAPVHEQSLELPGGSELTLLDIDVGPEASESYGAMSTSIWYQVQLPQNSGTAWVSAISPTMSAIQQDGQTAAFVFNLIPVMK